MAFYDALETNDSAVKVLGDDNLRLIARELVATVRQNVSIDWTLRENVRAKLRVLVKRILRKHGYPPDKAEKATQTVLEQAEVLSEGWAAGWFAAVYPGKSPGFPYGIGDTVAACPVCPLARGVLWTSLMHCTMLLPVSMSLARRHGPWVTHWSVI